MHKLNPPYRAEHVGSFLRPAELKEARAKHEHGEIDAAALKAVEDKAILMETLGRKELRLCLQSPLARIPDELAGYPLALSADGSELVYTFASGGQRTGIAGLLRRLGEHGIDFRDLQTSESSLEEIFVNLVRAKQ